MNGWELGDLASLFTTPGHFSVSPCHRQLLRSHKIDTTSGFWISEDSSGRRRFDATTAAVRRKRQRKGEKSLHGKLDRQQMKPLKKSYFHCSASHTAAVVGILRFYQVCRTEDSKIRHTAKQEDLPIKKKTFSKNQTP